MKTSTIIVLAFVAMVFGTFMLAEPTSALPRRDEGRCPSWVCQSDAFLRCCSSYSYSPGSCNDISRHYMFDCCPNHDFNGCVWYVLILHPFMNPRVSSYLICYDIFDIKSKSAWSLIVILFKNVLFSTFFVPFLPDVKLFISLIFAYNKLACLPTFPIGL